jgi:hypothetical protein
MTAAVEKSYMMIIFVSPEYKESTNCRIEGLYGFKRASNSGLKLVYVMMNENFTTETRPVVVDGWLGGMIGAELWYPLWKKEQLHVAVSSVAAKLGNNAKLNERVPFPVISSSLKISSPISHSSSLTSPSFDSSSKRDALCAVLEIKLEEDSDFATAFECLQKEKSLSPDSFAIIFQNHNISDPEDFKCADLLTILCCLVC